MVEEFEFFNTFDPKDVKSLIHLITIELKSNESINIEYLFLPLRNEQTNEKLLKFLNKLFPLSNGIPIDDTKKIIKLISITDHLTLFQTLKYIWCRLSPNGEIISWKSYYEFKFKEIELNFPQKSFLEIMPKCLNSSHQASIVYDFFDLIVTVGSNSKINKMSTRKISKMCAIWAFNNKRNNKSLQDGLEQWIPASNAMFHLLLAFLKSFVPDDNNLDNSKLPKSLKKLLFNNDYPPSLESNETVLTIPLVTIYTNKFSKKPWELLENCNDLLDFNNHNLFKASEDYALLKSLFAKKNNVEGISRKMSQESKRLIKLMSTKHSTFQAGWYNYQSDNVKLEKKTNY